MLTAILHRDSAKAGLDWGLPSAAIKYQADHCTIAGDWKTSVFSRPPREQQSGHIVVAFDGRIHNRGHLCGRASILPRVAGSDAELIWYLYLRYGHECMEEVVGEFRGVIYDEQDRSMSATVDFACTRRLWWREMGTTVVVATEIAGLYSEKEDVRLEEDYLIGLLAAGWNKDRQGPFRGAQRLLPGERLHVASKCSVSRYWCPTKFIASNAGNRTVRDCAAELRDRLADAVRQRLPESGALLSELSGGLDSTSITMLAGRFFAEEPGRLHAVTVGNSEAPSSDESGLAAIVAKAAGARHYVLEWGSSKPLFEGMPENAYFWDEPRFNVNSHAFAVAKSQLMNSIGARNVFSGAGAEVVLCAQMMWPVFLADALIWGRWAELGRGLGWWRESSRMPWSVLLYRSCIAPLLLPRSAMTAEGKNIEPPWLTTRARKRAKQLSAHHPPPLVDRLNSGGAWMAEQWQGAASAADQGYGEFAYHTSFPFLDRPLVESVLRMPWNARVHPRTNKPLLRTVARELLPEGFAMRWSIRADQSVGRRLSRQREWIKKLIAPSVLVDLGIVEGKTLRETLSAHEEGFGRGLRFTVTILAVELWAQSVRSGDWWEKRRRLLRHLVPSYSHSKPSTAHGGTGDSVSDMRRTSVHLHDALPLTSDPL